MHVVGANFRVKTLQIGQFVWTSRDETVCSVEDIDLGQVSDVIPSRL